MTIILTTPAGALGIPKFQMWAGRVATALFVAFMVADTGIKLAKLQVVADALNQLGFRTDLGFSIGILQAVLLVLYLITRTSILGAVLFTGLFGGAFAAHLRVGSPLYTHDLFGVYLGILAWGGLWLRDGKLRALFPIRR